MNENDKRNFLDQFADDHDGGAAERIETHAAFALVRGVRPNIFMIELRFKTGNVVAFDYGWLSRAEFNPTRGIVLRVDRGTVTLTGTHLRPLYDAIVRKRAIWVQESDALVAAASIAETAVTGIAIESDER